MVLVAKALSGGHAPVGAVLGRRRSSTRCSIAWTAQWCMAPPSRRTIWRWRRELPLFLDVIEAEKLVENAAARGADLIARLSALIPTYELLKEVRGKGLMIGVEYGAPKSLKLKAAWSLLETVNAGLFCQMITIPLFKDHRDSQPGRRPRQPYDQLAARAHHHARGLRLDRVRLCGDDGGGS